MERSIVEYFSGHDGYKCGYCNSTDTCFSHGMWAHTMSPLDYQNLIDRGWRRSGKYCYKPTMSVTCCPLYTIRCEAKKFTLTRSQKKVLKKVHKFLAYGDKGKTNHQSSKSNENADEHDMDVSEFPQEIDMQSLKRIKKVKTIKQSDVQIDNSEETRSDNCSPGNSQNERCDRPSSSHCSPSKSSHSTNPSSEPTSPLKSSSLSNSVPQCRKAKVIRQERKLQKLLKMGIPAEEAAASIKKKTSDPKSIEDFLTEPMPPNPAHKLELRLVPSALENPLFCQTFEESYSVYKKYQMTIHEDPAEKCSTKQYTRFLVNSPFQGLNECPSSNKLGYGSFHHQYWLDDKLIAVGVIDILPYCVSSVYFYYDPDYSFLSLGTFAALKEIALTRELNNKFQDLQYYYMGYYIHSCIKMRYKGQYVPSFLLCPETNIFQPIEKCRPKLDISKYHRLEDDPKKEDTDGVVNLKELVILYNKTKMTYLQYRNLNKKVNDENDVQEYGKFVGRKCYRKMLLYRDS